MNAIERSLIAELFDSAMTSPTGVNAKEFRAKHEDYLDVLDRLERSPYVERRDNHYRIKLVVLAELKDADVRAGTIIRQCDQVFRFLRAAYKGRTDVPLALGEIVEKTGIPEFQLRLALVFLTDASIWGGYTSDLLHAKEVTVVPSESILRYKTFDDVIQPIREWANRWSHQDSALPPETSHEPLFIREMNVGHPPAQNGCPQWYANLPDDIHQMLREVRYALEKELSALPSMGLRSVVDMICNNQVGDIGGFQEKLGKLEEERLITPKKRQLIQTVLEVGHASMHRGHFPASRDLNLVMDVVDHLLEELYVLDKTSDSLIAAVPKRQPKRKDE